MQFKELGSLETKVMGILWEQQLAMSVNDVRGLLDVRLAYRTVMTKLDRLHRKGMLSRNKAGQRYVYWFTISGVEFEVHNFDAFFAEYASSPAAIRDVIMSKLIDTIADRDPALLDELERKIEARRTIGEQPRPTLE